MGHEKDYANELQQLINSMKSGDYSSKNIELIREASTFLKKIIPVNMTRKYSVIKKAFNFSQKQHSEQKRMSGEPYFIHPFSTALILAKYGADAKTVAAALLHDVLEDTDVKPEEIKKEFDEEILELVEGVTKLTAITREKQDDIVYMQKMLEASNKDIRILLIKLADKLHNIRTLNYLSKEKQKWTAEKAVQVYTPLAHRLGLHVLEHEIEDLCFPYLYPTINKSLKEKLRIYRGKKEKSIKKMIKILKKKPEGKKLEFEIYHKGIYRIYQKMLSSGKELEEISDPLALIVLTNSVSDCYSSLGLIHSTFTPVPKKLKDFIALPTQPTYQSIHTTVIGPNEHPIKIYIRTKEMHDLSIRGVIGLIRDKKRMKDYMKKWHAQEIKKNAGKEEFFSALTNDYLKPRITAYASDGKTYSIQDSSTALDFAFRVKGNKALCLTTVKVNNKKVPLWHKLKSCDLIEVSCGKQSTVEKSWLGFVERHVSKEKIKNALSVKSNKSKNLLIPISFEIKVSDKPGLLYKISNEFSKKGINIDDIRSGPYGTARKLFVSFKVPNKEKANEIEKKVLTIDGILEVKTN